MQRHCGKISFALWIKEQFGISLGKNGIKLNINPTVFIFCLLMLDKKISQKYGRV